MESVHLDEIRVVTHVAPEAVWAAFWAFTGEVVDDAHFGGLTDDGREVEFGAADVIEGMCMAGPHRNEIHVWASRGTPTERLVHFFAHEVAHIVGADAAPLADEEERWAEHVGEIAAAAYRLAESLPRKGRRRLVRA